ncbi:GH92 family glycosyl hydrolase [Phocaeicola sp.]|uniref:GH92 family glycosyl hydrolase n=1 Tax=Phocaeicola sp. TaxID=2773926 RepID=UPI0023D638D2|nr:GH92 family glycosyl hydrolase [Phocaeicola sp.]MDE5677281.1 GH92 family glycosyl hydrolase [Phocaeicola sp.]
MKNKSVMLFVWVVCLACIVLGACSTLEKDNTVTEEWSAYVEPRIGTAHCRWFHFTPGAVPFGMAKPAPSTNGHLGNRSGWEATGYDYRDTSIEGFPCLHEFQVGGIVLMPTSGELVTVPGLPGDSVASVGYRSSFDRNDEIATAGYYSVFLKDYNIQAELTATPRVAFQRFTFPSGNENHLLFDIGNRQGESGLVRDAEVVLTDDGRIEGWVITEPEYVKKYQPGAVVPLYFSAVLDKNPVACGAFNGATLHPDSRKATGIGAGLYLTFHTQDRESVTAKVGLSYTSVENARLNRETEAAHLTFDEAKAIAHDTWEEYLGRIRVETSNHDDKVKFYTGLYHALLGRGLASDVNGAYPRHDGMIGQIELKDGKPIHNLYNTDAAWGAQWNLSQLWIMAYPEYISDYISSHLLVYKDSGWLADGLANSRYVSGVGTNLLSTIIAGAYQCGIRDFDTCLAYEACLKNELDGTNRPLGAGKVDTENFVTYGYVPHADSGEGPDEAFMFSASHTLEYSFSAWAVAQWARQLGKTEDYEKLIHLSKGWERLYDASANFVRPKKKDGSFIDHFDPMQVWRGFQEGNAWQYTFYVPHDAKELVAKVGADEFNQRLDSIFSVSRKLIFSGGTEVGAFAGLQTLYNHGNQPCLHTSWLFNEAGHPSQTQKWVRAILNEFYGTDGIHGYGYGQDEDQGQLGAWYVIASMGLFDMKGLTASDPAFALGSPLFDKVTIRLNNTYYKGKEFIIKTRNNGDSCLYVQQFKLNGKVLDTPRLPFSALSEGGVLELEMGDTPKDNYK